MRFEVNETPNGVVTPDKNICKVKGCGHVRFVSKRPYAVCKEHSGLKNQMSRAKFSALASNNELIILEGSCIKEGTAKGPTSKKKKLKLWINKVLDRVTLSDAPRTC